MRVEARPEKSRFSRADLSPVCNGPQAPKALKYWEDHAMQLRKPRLSRKHLVFYLAMLVPVALVAAGLFYRGAAQRQDPTNRDEQLERWENEGSVAEKQSPMGTVFPSQQPEKQPADHSFQDLQPHGISPEQPATDLIGRQARPDSGQEELIYFGERYSEPFETKKIEELLSMANTLCRDEIDHDLPSDIWISPHLLMLDMEENHRRLRQLHMYCTRKEQGQLQSDDEERARQIKRLFLIERLDAITWFEEDMTDIFAYEQSEEIRVEIDAAKEEMIALMLDALERYETKW
jgi:hypothetical protein